MFFKGSHQVRMVNKNIDTILTISKMKNNKMNRKNKILKKIAKFIANNKNNRKMNKLKEANHLNLEIIDSKKIQRYRMEEVRLIKKRNSIKKNLHMLNGIKCKMRITSKIIKI